MWRMNRTKNKSQFQFSRLTHCVITPRHLLSCFHARFVFVIPKWLLSVLGREYRREKNHHPRRVCACVTMMVVVMHHRYHDSRVPPLLLMGLYVVLPSFVCCCLCGCCRWCCLLVQLGIVLSRIHLLRLSLVDEKIPLSPNGKWTNWYPCWDTDSSTWTAVGVHYLA